MKKPKAAVAAPLVPSSDALLQVQTLIARRADELSSQPDRRRGHDLECWLQAEREIFGGLGGEDPAARLVSALAS